MTNGDRNGIGSRCGCPPYTRVIEHFKNKFRKKTEKENPRGNYESQMCAIAQHDECVFFSASNWNRIIWCGGTCHNHKEIMVEMLKCRLWQISWVDAKSVCALFAICFYFQFVLLGCIDCTSYTSSDEILETNKRTMQYISVGGPTVIVCLRLSKIYE